MSKNVKNESESPAIIEEIIPGKNTDYNDKSLNKNNNNNNNQQPSIENYNEQEAAQAVIDVSEESIARNTNESANQISRSSQVTSDTQKQTAHATREISENYWELQRQAIDSFQSVFMPYFQNIQNQLWGNQEYFNTISGLYYKLVSDYTESAIAFSRIFNDMSSSNMNFLTGLINSLSVNQTRKSSFKLDSGRNSDENSTNIKAIFSCETCRQTFGSRQDLKEHTSIAHYHIL